MRARLNPRLSIGGVLLTMVDGRTRLSADVADEVRKHFGDRVFNTTIPRSVRLAEAPSHGLAGDRVRPPLRRRGCVLARGERARRAARSRRGGRVNTPQRRGLGRGLEVLVGGAAEGPELAHLRVDEIQPNARQPRRRFEPEATTGLAESIRHEGMLQPGRRPPARAAATS